MKMKFYSEGVESIRGKMDLTLALIPAFSPGRRRNARRLFAKLTTAWLDNFSPTRNLAMACPLLGEETGEGERKTKFQMPVATPLELMMVWDDDPA
jgi:hypothetical protein